MSEKTPPLPPAERIRHLLSPAQLVAVVPGLTERHLRQLLFEREANGLGEHVLRVGGKLFIDEVGFAEWLCNTFATPRPENSRKSPAIDGRAKGRKSWR